MIDEYVKDLVEKHWQYTKKIIESSSNRSPTKSEYTLYIESGIHFYKHALEDVRAGKIKPEDYK